MKKNYKLQKQHKKTKT